MAQWALWRGLADSLKGQTKALLAPYIGSGNFTHRALKEVTALSSCFAAARARRAESPTGATMPLLPSAEAWQRCVAVGCGWPNCVVAAGLYALQLRSWRAAFAAGSFPLFPLSEWHRAPAAARHRLFSFLGLQPSPSPPSSPLSQPTSSADALGPEVTATGEDTLSCADEYISKEAGAALARGRGVPRGAAAALQAFYAAFSAPLRSELSQLSQPLHRWQPGEAWLWLDRPDKQRRRTGAGRETDEEGVGTAGEDAARKAAAPAPPPGGAGALVEAGGAEEEDKVDEDATALPTLFLLGGEKCGSTSLAFALTRHPQLHMARHVLPAEPAYFRKELHFFDDDLRYMRGLPFYAAHFPRCARDAAAGAATPQYWRGTPSAGVEVLLEDARSGEAVGWDAELNVPTNAHNTVLLVPAAFQASNGNKLYSVVE